VAIFGPFGPSVEPRIYAHAYHLIQSDIICSDNHLWMGKVFQGSVSQHTHTRARARTHPVGRATHLPLRMLTPCDGEMPNDMLHDNPGRSTSQHIYEIFRVGVEFVVYSLLEIMCSRGCSSVFNIIHRLYRATLCVSAVFAVVRCPSVCLSVCLSRSCIVSRRLKISSNFFFGLVAPSLVFF